MKTTLSKLVVAEPALLRLGEPIQTIVDKAVVLVPQPVSATTAYRLAKLIKSVRDETEFYRTRYRALIKELGVEREPTKAEAEQGMQGPVTEVASANRDTFTEKVKELDATPVEIEKWLLTVEMLGDVKVSIGDMLALGELISDTDGPPISVASRKKKAAKS